MERRLRRDFASVEVYWLGLVLLLVAMGFPASLPIPGARLTQSRMASETATEWIEFGDVSASVVAKVPPMREPRRDI